ncbi:hypothetical protein D4764_03G0000150 [Takifugu flavidus]|uniref:Uncharacterized protein n=1 Tax=Takifugu flavidus TaxID=433684 RepID=A0A5C6NBH6_9TELE|nr:hypothetical protein D4764_03G0000150 [Takifugu flavidus]
MKESPVQLRRILITSDGQVAGSPPSPQHLLLCTFKVIQQLFQRRFPKAESTERSCDTPWTGDESVSAC